MRRVDLVVVGAGAAGVMAWHAATGVRPSLAVAVLEKKGSPLRKFRITGKGRCNLTNCISSRLFLERLGKRGRFLHSALERFDSARTAEFFGALGVATVVERGERLFPASGSAVETADRFAAALLAARPQALFTGANVRDIRPEPGGFVVETSAGDWRSRRVICAPGGLTYPLTGSDGAFYAIAARLGHTVVPPRHALCGMLAAPGSGLAVLAGVALKNIAARLVADGKTAASAFGELLFTHTGVSGPTVLHLSRDGRDRFDDAGAARGRVELAIDFKPAIPDDEFDARVIRELSEAPRKGLLNALGSLLPKALLEAVFAHAGLPPELRAGEVSKALRRAIRSALKDFRIPLAGLCGPEEAVITLGGIALAEVDPRTMESKRVPGLHFAGELLDLDGPTGGFNLQIAFATGDCAGRAAAEGLG